MQPVAASTETVRVSLAEPGAAKVFHVGPTDELTRLHGNLLDGAYRWLKPYKLLFLFVLLVIAFAAVPLCIFQPDDLWKWDDSAKAILVRAGLMIPTTFTAILLLANITTLCIGDLGKQLALTSPATLFQPLPVFIMCALWASQADAIAAAVLADEYAKDV